MLKEKGKGGNINFCYRQEVTSHCAKEGFSFGFQVGKKKYPEKVTLKLSPWTVK